MKKQHLKVLIYSDHFYPLIGGSENYGLDLASELTRKGHEARVITPERNSRPDDLRFEILRLKKPLLIARANFNFIEIFRIINSFRPDILHINYQSGSENLLILIAKLLRVPVLITYHADHVVPIGRLIDEVQMRSTFKLANKIQIQTDRDYKHFQWTGYPKSKLVLFRFNGVDAERYHCNRLRGGIRARDALRLLFVAKLDDSHKYKGTEFLFKALRKLELQKYPRKILLNIVGEGNCRSLYQEQTSDLDFIHFLGELSEEDLLEAYCSSDLLILPSTDKGEGFGRVAVEAMSCGMPVIVSNMAGIAEIIKKHKAGIVYDHDSVDELCRAIEKFAVEADELEFFSKQAKNLVRRENLTLSKTVDRTIQCYMDILNSTKRAHKSH